MKVLLNGRIVARGAALSNKESPQSAGLLARMLMKVRLVPAAIAAALAVAAVSGATAYAQSAAANRSAAAAPTATTTAPTTGATRYEDITSQRSFVMQQNGREAIVKFEDSPEIMVLQAIPAQRGDIFLRNDAGQVMFRLTDTGSLVSYVDNANGAPVARAGLAAPLSIPPMAASLNELRTSAAARLTRLAGHEVTVFGAAEFAANEAWAAEALTTLVAGVEKANGPSGRLASKLNKVRMVRALAASVAFQDGELVLGVNPNGGPSGRPSADAIALALTAARSTN